MPYIPSPIFRPDNVADLVRFVQQEFQKLGIESAKPSFNLMFLDVLHEAPDNPREGMLAVADGTNWTTTSGNPRLVMYVDYLGTGAAWYEFSAMAALP